MEDLEWARILVKTSNEVLLSRLDIVVEEACYSLSLWWEVRPEMRKVSTGSRSNGGSREEVRGDAAARATPRVEELESARPEVLLLPADGIDGQDSGAGGDGTGKRVQVGYGARASLDQEVGLYQSGPSAGRLGLKIKSPWISPSIGRHGVAIIGVGPGDDPLSFKAQWGDKIVTSPLKGLKLKGVVIDEVGPGDGPSYSKPNWWADDGASPEISGSNGLLGECLGPSQPESRRGSLERACLWAQAYYYNGRNCEAEFLKIREKEDEWKQQMASSHSVTDRALIEEELRYGSALIQWGVRASGYSSSFSLPFDRTPKGKYYNHSRVLCEEI